MDSRDSTLYMPAGGGHADYAGNEVQSIKLSDGAPVWVERRASTPVSQITLNTTHYSDGRPTSRHSYYGVTVNEVRNRVMLFCGALWGDGRSTRATDGFNMAANDWDSAQTYPNVPGAMTNLYAAAIIEHKGTGDVYGFANFGVYRWSNQSNAWSTVASNTPVAGYEAASALDTRRNRVLILGGLNGDRHLFNLSTNQMQSATLSGPNAGNVGGNGNGMVYEPWLDAFIVRKRAAGSVVYKIDAATLAVTTLTTAGGSSLPSSINDVYRRFLFAPQLGGIVFCPDYNDDVWFLRTT